MFPLPSSGHFIQRCRAHLRANLARIFALSCSLFEAGGAGHEAPRISTMDATKITDLLKGALTDKISDREVFMKGVDYSYYYEQEDDISGSETE